MKPAEELLKFGIVLSEEISEMIKGPIQDDKSRILSRRIYFVSEGKVYIAKIGSSEDSFLLRIGSRFNIFLPRSSRRIGCETVRRTGKNKIEIRILAVPNEGCLDISVS